MTNIRLIPLLLMQDKKLVKTIRFKQPHYIGDPINSVQIFNDLFVDELILLDISQSEKNTAIDFDYLQGIVSHCFMPICYGGGITSLETAIKLFSIGIEKIAINMAASKDLAFLKTLSQYFGSQSIVAAIDYKRNFFQQYQVVVHNKKKLRYHPVEYAHLLVEQGIGELLLTCIDREGTMSGYDLEIITQIADEITIPIIMHGGAGSLLHLKEVYDKTGITAFAAGSLFVYSGALKGVLINYPTQQEIKSVLQGKPNGLPNL